MKWKQLLLIVAVSASSAVGSVWMYENLSSLKKRVYTVPRKANCLSTMQVFLKMEQVGAVIRSILRKLPMQLFRP